MAGGEKAVVYQRAERTGIDAIGVKFERSEGES